MRLHKLMTLSLVLALGGCAAGETDGDGEGDIGEWTGAGRVGNGLSPDEFLNAVSANPTALAMLSSMPLSAVFTDPYFRMQTHDPDARTYLEYLIGCALPASASLTAVDPFTGIPHTYVGDLGLHANWLGAPPSPAGLQRVSGCMLARVNAYGVTVVVSMRGEPAGMFPVAPRESTNFKVEEGSFYGDIFHLAAGVHVRIEPSGEKVSQVPTPWIYPQMWTCFDPTYAAATSGYDVKRVCATDACVAIPVGDCATACGIPDGPARVGDGDNDMCLDAAGTTWTHPVTTYLRGKCDLVPDPTSCS